MASFGASLFTDNGVRPDRLAAAPRWFSGKSSMQDLSAKGLFSVIVSYGTFLINTLFFLDYTTDKGEKQGKMKFILLGAE